ncbi:MAG: type II secretion system protein [Campylobacteraceae bacterium]|jgi:hypothetical protein|nr:type II secretion system protein [Campylobacteraceae bacterium]
MRKGFGLIMAIAFIVLVATIGALALSFSTQTSKQTGDIYLRTQAELLAISGAEYAILALTAHNIVPGTGNCINNINIEHNNMFDIAITLQYIGSGLPDPGCNILDNFINTIDSSVTVLMDVIVTSRTEPIRIHRRTLQKL